MPDESSRVASVLVVDRDAGSRRAFEDLLAGEGYRVLHAPDAVRAIRLFDSESPDLVLTDADLPNFGADVVISHVRDRAPEVPIIIVTAEHPDDAAQAQHQKKADQVLNKPLELAEITRAVASALGNARRVAGG